MTITLIDMGPKVLVPFTEISQNYATEILTARGVQLRLGASVKEITKSGLIFADGSALHTDLVIWAGGLKAARLASALGLTRGQGGRIDVQPDLSVPGYPGVYALGDFANVVADNGKALPQLGSVAQQAGRHCAANILAAVAGEEQKPFAYLDKGIMAMVGRNEQ
jgi:NADH dehydrogenase